MLELKPGVSTVTAVIIVLMVTPAILSRVSCRDKNLKKCICYTFPEKDEIMTFNCSGQKFRTVPAFPKNSTATIIYLNDSKIKNFNENVTFPSSVTFLDLSFNELRDFTHNAFRGLINLKQLNLSNNLFLLPNNVLPSSLFTDLIHLEELNIQDNADRQLTGNLENDVIKYTEVFAELKNLKTLQVDALYFPYFSQNFSSLINLKTLALSGRTGICSLVFLNSSAFSPFVALESLNISDCRLQWINKGTFKKLSLLNTLDISYNDELTFQVLPNVSYDLQFIKTMKELRLTKLHCTFGMGTIITLKQSKYFFNTSIEILYLDSNRINTIEYGAPKYLPPSLKKLYMMDNRFTFGKYLFEGASFPNITDYYGSHQYTSHDPTKPENRVFICNDRKFHRHGYSVHRRSFPVQNKDILKQQRESKTIQLMLNAGSKDRIFPRPIFKIYIPKTLRRVIIRYGSLQYPIPMFEVNDDNQAEYFDLSGNQFPVLLGPVMGFNKLKHLNLSNVFCSEIKQNFFSHLGSLENLTLSYNFLASCFHKDENGQIFEPLQKLTHLDISDNKISILNPYFFKGPKNLQVLDIHSNFLSEWQTEINHLRNLKIFNLSYNNLNSLSSKLVVDIEAINVGRSDTGKLEVDFSHNIFTCSCDTVHEMKWFIGYKNHLTNFENLLCRFTNGSTISFSELEHAVSVFDKGCNSYIGIIFGISALILIVLVVLISGIVYRYRWKLRYLYYMSRNKYKGYKLLSQSENDGDFDYDVFVSYADEDKDFVTNQMMEKLEGIFEFRLCISSRDFQPGTPIAANITNAINRSRKTVAVITKNFLTSYWCMFEFNMAKMESIYSRNGKEILFLIFYEKISLKSLPHQVLELINSNSFIEYPHHPQGNEVFWEKIRDTINS